MAINNERLVNFLPINDKQKKIFNRRVNKLKKDPKGFFEGSFKKRSLQIKENLPIKYSSNNHYTIVTALYNSEKYLDKYFSSITNQTLNFRKNIKIICVDDGSEDGSAYIVEKWKRKYPKNITYIYKKNGGQASARNIGLKEVRSEWVTFIDSDDFIPRNYFKVVDEAILSNNKIKAIATRPIYYIEETEEFKDAHPLSYRFENNSNLVPCNDLKKNIQFSAALAFVKVSTIPKGLIFDEKLRPTFEDGKFINTYLLKQSEDSLIYFHPEAKYYNRKREDKSSTMDNVWRHKGQFSTVLKEGYLQILEDTYESLGYVPVFIQRTILWEILRLVKRLMNREERVSFLDENEKINLVATIKQIFKYIDKSTILRFELGKCGYSRQLGMLGCFKGMDVDRQVVYIEDIDHTNRQVLVRFFSCFDPLFKVYTEKGEILPIDYKKADRRFLMETFLTEHRLWIPVPDEGTLKVSIDQKNAFITYLGKKYKDGLNVNNIKFNTESFLNTWVLMDRDDVAGDNAEFLYEYIKSLNVEKNIYFILNENSVDWMRLQSKGFNLIGHGTLDHKRVLENCSLVISSQTNRLIEPFHNLNKRYKVVFLQHGVIKDDLSNWLNTVDMDLMLTSSYDEYQSIVSNHSPYKYGKKEVKLTGLPRFDSLYKNRNNYKKQILIMFTWRRSVAGGFINRLKSQRDFNYDFMDSNYYKSINNLLNSSEIQRLSVEEGVEFVFCPHPNMINYIDCFEIPNCIRVVDKNERIHDLVNSSSMLITDYSSLAFDFAYQSKPVVYYQFDKEDFANGEHTYTPGYFNYYENGFGPVFTQEESLISSLKNLVSDYVMQQPYKSRAENVFAYRDSNNCERVYEIILNLEFSNSSKISVDTILEYTQHAITHEAWDLALDRINNALQHSDITHIQLKEVTEIKERVIQVGYQDFPVKLANILWNENRIDEALAQLKQFDNIELTDEMLRLRVKLAILNNDFKLAKESQKLLLKDYNKSCSIEDWQFYIQLATIV